MADFRAFERAIVAVPADGIPDDVGVGNQIFNARLTVGKCGREGLAILTAMFVPLD
jgi:hypothetical protein